MTSKIKTKVVDKILYSNYLKKASEFLKSAEKSLLEKDFNSAAVNAVHCFISAVDCLTTAKLGLRHSGDRHEEAIKLINMVNGLDRDMSDKISGKFKAAIGMKNMAEYEERLVKPKDAEKIVRDAKEVFGIISGIAGNR
jgi:HEPN domain-containing protein